MIDNKQTYQSSILYALRRCSFFTRFSTSPICSDASSKFSTRTYLHDTKIALDFQWCRKHNFSLQRYSNKLQQPQMQKNLMKITLGKGFPWLSNVVNTYHTLQNYIRFRVLVLVNNTRAVNQEDPLCQSNVLPDFSFSRNRSHFADLEKKR